MTGSGRWPQVLALVNGENMHYTLRLPDVDEMLPALEAAKAKFPPGDPVRRTLTEIIGVVAWKSPVVPRRTDAARCPNCPWQVEDLLPLRLGHTGNAHHTYLHLLNADVTDCAQIAAMTDKELLAVPRIGLTRLDAIRQGLARTGGDDDG